MKTRSWEGKVSQKRKMKMKLKRTISRKLCATARNFGRKTDKGWRICCFDSCETLPRRGQYREKYVSRKEKKETHLRSIHRLRRAYPLT